MFRKFGIIFTGLLTFFAATTPVQAITVGGENYDRFLSLTSGPNDALFYWIGENKIFTTSPSGQNTPISTDTAFLASELSGYDVEKFYTMGKSKYYLGPTAMQTIAVKDGNGGDLLTAGLKGTGNLDLVLSKSSAGHFNLTGLFDVTGGTWGTNKLVTGTIYVEIFFRTFYDVVGTDYRAKNGTINLYWKHPGGGGGGSSEVPEPATLSLLAAGALGLGARRRKRAA